jgi:hypothetical protein
LIHPDFDEELDEEVYLSENLIHNGRSEGTRNEEVHNFLSAKLQ